MKHGLRSAKLLLPGDDVAEFHERRREALETFRPRTRAETRCVDIMVRLEWRMERCERWQEVYDAKQNAVVGEGPDEAAGPHCEADPHRWMHRSMDCTVQTRRMERQRMYTLRWLQELQRLRRQNLLSRVDEMEAEDGEWTVEADAGADVAPPDEVPTDAVPERGGAAQEVHAPESEAATGNPAPKRPPGATVRVNGDGQFRTASASSNDRNRIASKRNSYGKADWPPHTEKRRSGGRGTG